MISYNISSIETLGLSDGPGIRTVIFFQGCLLRCKYCHNPETWKQKGGEKYLLDDLIKFIKKYKTYFGKNGGVTFSGGEPLLQGGNLLILAQKLKEENINIALDTAGYYNEEDYENVKNLLDYVDLVIMDIKALEKGQYQEITGGKLDKSLDFVNLCQMKQKKMWLRSVIVPTINDNLTYLDKLAEFVKENVLKVELLGYHNMAISKYDKLHIVYPYKKIKPLEIEKLVEYQDYLDKKINS